ncbi:MAG: 2,3-dihydroxyphenylpropionate 1,2-dioxygenase [Blastocatellia bacterium]|jgi:2,3-dihydroxyphenylpropionate 1,2-dioxygenase|nr:2,3-dihydroxyphenylpropionate 1,2-dioxygenase [Blastocatellia bacterium]
MPSLTICMSHTPLRGHFDPPVYTLTAISEAIEEVREKIRAFSPDLVFLFAPDHYNGFFYHLMPQFCVGVAADAIGDFGTARGPISVPRTLALNCANALLGAGVDVAVSYRMKVDHGFADPLNELFGTLNGIETIPVFINAVSPPLAPFRRSRLLGEAVGRFAATLDRRVLFLGSGGLSHEPPVPRLSSASPALTELLIEGGTPSEAQTQAREDRVIDAAKRLVRGDPSIKSLNPRWDRGFLDTIQSNDLGVFDGYSDEEVSRDAGESAHEVRTWIAAVSALAASGEFTSTVHLYEAVPEWIAGFAVMSAEPIASVTRN